MEFKEYRLSELVEIIGGGTPKRSKPEYWDGEIPWLSVKDFNNGLRLVKDTQEKITVLGLKKSSTKLLKSGDLIISARGTVGAVAQLDKPMAFNQSCYGLRANTSLTTNEFIYYWLKYHVNYLKSNTHGSVFDTITRETFNNLHVDLPSLANQIFIANILTRLDEKIDTNNSVIFILEQLAQTLFKRWFVDFEFPNENGDPYKSSGGEMVESELGMIPAGWEEGTLNDIGTIVGGGTPSKKIDSYYTTKGYSWITPKDLSNDKSVYIYKGNLDITEEALKKSSAKLHPVNTVLFSSRAPIGYVAIAGQEVATNQGFKSIIPKRKIPSEYVYLLLKHLTPVIESNASGSTFKEISGAGMKGEYKILCVNRKKEVLSVE